jgi:SAM-dependent MidA family methyltransferase
VKNNAPASVSTPLQHHLNQAIADAGGWLPFDRFMALALYHPGLGYYARDSRQFGLMPASGSDFVTAPELSPLFGATLARQVRQALATAGCRRIVEFGAGSGALAEQLLQALGDAVDEYLIVDLSGALQDQQRHRLAAFAPRVHWLNAWPETLHAVVIGNEVLDAMPVQLLHFDGNTWFERGVVSTTQGLTFADRATALRPPVADEHFVAGAVTEIHPQAEAFVRSLAERLTRGAALFVDYGFPEHEYYHRQRNGGTLMCHRGHVADANPLLDVGDKDITAHVNFSGIALAAQDAGLTVDGYTSQARFLFNSGLVDLMQTAPLREQVSAQKLVNEHEMGELFKVLCLSRGLDWSPLGFAVGDRSHTL